MDIINKITVEDFKAYFPREFQYLKVWDAETTYNKNVIVYYNNLFYQSLIDGNINNIPSDAVDDWKHIEDDYNNYINDDDISKAMGQAKGMFNVNLFKGHDELLKICYLLLVAHYLVQDLNMSKGNGASSFIMTSKSVDGVSASYGIPQKILDNPLYSYLTGTSFGLKYLQYVLPRLIGYSVAVYRRTNDF